MEWNQLQRRARVGRRILVAALAMVAVCIGVGLAQDKKPEPAPQVEPERPEIRYARGVVFHDKNTNGTRDEGEPGIAGVRVSNQHQVVATDENGAWELAHDDDTTFFVVKPAGWRTPTNKQNLPRFFYHHRPAGSPKLRFGGIPPTGELPKSIDFPLVQADEPEDFDVVFFADPQPYDLQQVSYVANDAVAELVGTKAAFGVTLGDIVGNDLNLFQHINAAISRVGIPWYNVIGNHDLNFDAATDIDSDETFRRVYGPNYYSWDYGKVHFVALDNVYWDGNAYLGYLPESQLNWLEADLAHVPPDRAVVLMMHIPLTSRIPLPTLSIRNRASLYEIIQTRTRVLAISGHTHTHHHMFIEEDAWKGEAALEHANIVTVSGCWWRGEPDERGIPHATMRCGGPNGYVIASFKGNEHSLRYKAAGRDDDYQMNIQAPDEVWSDRAEGVPVYVNVFGGSERSAVEWRINDGEWQRMEWTLENDPAYVETALRQRMPSPLPSNHLWKSALPAGLVPGTHVIEVRAADVYDQRFEGRRLIRVMDAQRRPEIASIEPAVLLPGGEIVVKCARLAGSDVQILVPTGDRYTEAALRATRDGDSLKARLPATLVGGSLRVRSDLLLSDPRVFELGSAAKNGLRAEYFRLENPDRTLPDLSGQTPVLIRRDANIDFADARSFALPFDTDFAVRWTGRLNAAQGGEYAFALQTDDGSRLWIDGELVVDNDNANGQRQRVGKATLTAGMHEIRVEYMQRGNEASAVFKWKPPGVDDGASVPTDVLFPPEAK